MSSPTSMQEIHQQRLLQDLAMKQRELKRKEKEIERLRMAFEEAHMDEHPHGICVIINNHKFYHPIDPEKAHSNRRGAEVNQKNLKLTFEYLCYKVELYENLTLKCKS